MKSPTPHNRRRAESAAKRKRLSGSIFGRCEILYHQQTFERTELRISTNLHELLKKTGKIML